MVGQGCSPSGAETILVIDADWRMAIQFQMEEYQTKRQYLRHLKKIAEIREGMGKLPVFTQNVNLSRSKTKQWLGTSCKSSMIYPQFAEGKHHTSTERIMRDFTVQKENTRLVTKILKMNSSIPLKKYEQDYEDSKKYIRGDKIKRDNRFVSFRFFDINFAHGASSAPQDYYQIYLKENQSKVLLTKGTLFEIRKKELKFRRKDETVLKIEGKSDEGTIKITESNLLDIKRHGQIIGHVVLEHTAK